VALRNALLLDTESSAPMLLVDRELPTAFRQWGHYQLDRLPPPLAPTEPDIVDLTSGE
jgi:hypothetical protein